MLPSHTLTIKEALEEHHGRFRRENITRANENVIENASNSVSTSTNYRPIDIAAVVLSITVNYSKRTAVIVIGDASLRSHECARVVFWGLPLSDLHEMIQMNITRGDIFRFNRVSVRDDYRICQSGSYGTVAGCGKGRDIDLDNSYSNLEEASVENYGNNGFGDNSNKANNNQYDNLEDGKSKNDMGGSSTIPKKNTTVVCDFFHSWKEPEPGISFLRIAKLSNSPHGSHIIKMDESSSFGNVMISTPKQIVDELILWFRERDHYWSSIFGQPWSSSLESLANMNTTRKRRRLQDLRLPNVICDLVVYVLSVDIIDQKVTGSIGQQKQGRIRSFLEGDTSSAIRAFAVLSDTYHLESKEQHSHSIVFYLDESTESFQTQLKIANQCNGRVLINQVLTQNCLSLFWCRGISTDDDAGSIVLIPTAKTTVQVLVEDQISSNSFVTRHQSSDMQHLSMLTPCSETFPFKNKFMGDAMNHRDRHTISSTRTVESSLLVSIHFDDLHITLSPRNNSKQKWPNLSSLASILIQSDKTPDSGITSCDDGHFYKYRSATLTLFRTNCNAEKKCKIVRACGEVMSMLCGSFHASSLRTEDCDGIEINLASGILKGLLILDVPLEWTILHNEANDEYDSVDSVYLPSLEV